MEDVARIWAEKIRDGDFPWFNEWIKRVDPATVVQELTLAGAVDPADLAAAFAAAQSSDDAERSSKANGSGTNGRGGPAT